MKFVIYAPGDYTPNGGGCVALHKLAHNIALLGEESYIMTSKMNPAYGGRMVTEREAVHLCKYEGAMAIYPEVTCGNPFHAKHITRWILYHIRNYGEFGIFGANDLIYKYASHFNLRNEQTVHGELRAVELNLEIFRDYRGERKGDCYLIKKGNDKEHNAHSETATKLDDYPSKGGNEYLSAVFNRCEMFISYDGATWLNVMAALCGCVSVVMPIEGISAEQWKSGFPYFKYGIAYGMNDLKHALTTRHLVKEELLKIEKETLEETRLFIEKAKSIL